MVDQTLAVDLDRAFAALMAACRRLEDEPRGLLTRFGLGDAHRRILHQLAQHPGSTVGELLRWLAITKQALNSPLRDLVDGGWVQMRQDPANRRAKRLHLSAGGATLERRLAATQHALLKDAFDAAPTAVEAWLQLTESLAAPTRPHSRAGTS